MAVGLDSFYSKLSLDDKGDESDSEVFLDKNGIDEIQSKGILCLCAKMLLRKPFNIDVMKTSFMKAWQLKDGLELGRCLNVFCCFISMTLWSELKFDCVNHGTSISLILFLLRYLMMERFFACPFWIQMQGLSILWMTDRRWGCYLLEKLVRFLLLRMVERSSVGSG